MKISKLLFRMGLFVVVILVLLLLYYLSPYAGEKQETQSISMIVYGSNSERWESLRQGAEQVAGDYSAEINLVTLSGEDNVEEQKALLQREIENGASAIMLAACDSSGMYQAVKDSAQQVPIVLIETGTEEDTFLSADNYEMGYTLGEAIVNNEIDKVKVAIICDNLQRNSVKRRYDGVCDALAGKIDRTVIWERNRNEADSEAMLFLQRELTEEAVDVVVSLDNTLTEALVDAMQNLNKNVKIYSIANTDKAVYHLDIGIIETLVYQNEFSVGYLGAEKLLGVEHDSGDAESSPVEFRAVTKETLYSASNQKMLFPFVK